MEPCHCPLLEKTKMEPSCTEAEIFTWLQEIFNWLPSAFITQSWEDWSQCCTSFFWVSRSLVFQSPQAVPLRAVSQYEQHICTQKLRTAEQPRLLWRSPCPAPLLKQGHLQRLLSTMSRWAFEYHQGCRPHHFSRQPVTVFDHPHSIEGFCVPLEFPVFQFVPTASCPVIGLHLEDSSWV